MKKSSIAVFFILFISFHLTALEADYLAYARGGDIWVSARLRDVEEEKILKTLEAGQKAEIFFNFRIYRRSEGLFRGDKLVASKYVVQQAYLDPFTSRFILDVNGGEHTYFFDKGVFFLLSFLSLQDYPLITLDTTSDLSSSREYYINARVTLNPVKLERPLHIISIFTNLRLVTDWEILEIGKPPEGGGLPF